MGSASKRQIFLQAGAASEMVICARRMRAMATGCAALSPTSVLESLAMTICFVPASTPAMDQERASTRGIRARRRSVTTATKLQIAVSILRERRARATDGNALATSATVRVLASTRHYLLLSAPMVMPCWVTGSSRPALASVRLLVPRRAVPKLFWEHLPSSTVTRSGSIDCFWHGPAKCAEGA